MANELKSLLAFCVDQGLLSQDASERIACNYERYWEDELDILIGNGVDEDELYAAAAREQGITLVPLDQLEVSSEAATCVSRNVSKQFFCIPYAETNDELRVITDRWGKVNVIRKGLANITGRTVDVRLITHREYNTLDHRLFGES